MSEMNPEILGTTDTALRLGCSAERVRQLERSGKLPAQKMKNGRRVFKADDVERLAAERQLAKQEEKLLRSTN